MLFYPSKSKPLNLRGNANLFVLIQMIEKIHDNVPEWVIGDETRITQIIMNLAGNAIKFTTKGSVTIEVSVENKNKNIRPLSITHYIFYQ